MSLDPQASRTIRGIALFEAFKGVIVIAAGFGALRLVHRDVRQVVVSLVSRLHIDPTGREAGLFNDVADHLTSGRLWTLAALAVAYSAVRFIEGYGLWFGRRWASWLGVIGGGIYVPVELYELIRHPTPQKFVVLLFNLAVVAYLVVRLYRVDRVVSIDLPALE